MNSDEVLRSVGFPGRQPNRVWAARMLVKETFPIVDLPLNDEERLFVLTRCQRQIFSHRNNAVYFRVDHADGIAFLGSFGISDVIILRFRSTELGRLKVVASVFNSLHRA